MPEKIKERGFVLPVALNLLFLSACASSAALTENIPITKNGKMSTVVLVLVERHNTIASGERSYSYPDGLVFYFVIYPSGTTAAPSIRQYQNFTVNGNLYWHNSPGIYDSHTVIYNERTFEEQEPAFARIRLRRNTHAFIQKTIICGDLLPPQGTVVYPLFFGFDRTLEEFEFRFDLKSIPSIKKSGSL